MRIIKVEKYGDEYKITEYKRHTGEKKSDVELPSDMDGRYDCNISRARSRIFELARCNEWEYFCTLTLSSEYDRTDLSAWRKSFTQWLRDYRKKGYDVKYLLVPERHQDGSWHMHGFFSGIGDVSPLAAADSGTANTSAEVAEWKAKDLNEQGNLIWRDYSRRWGYCTLSKVRNIEAASRYVTKYITKSLAMDNLISGAHLFYASRGLHSAECIAWNAIPMESDRSFYEGLSDCKHFCNEYIEQWWTKNPEKIAPLCNVITGEKFELTFSELSTD